MMEQHQLVAANTWSVRKPATHVQGNSVSQIDYVSNTTISITRPREELLSRPAACYCELERR